MGLGEEDHRGKVAIFITSYQDVKWSEVAQSCPTLCDPVDCSIPGSSVHGILQARILEWVTISFSRGTSRPRDQTWASRIEGRRFNLWATREALISREILNPFRVTSDPQDSQKSLVKWVIHGIELPSPKLYILSFPDCHFEAVYESYLRRCLLGCSSHLAPNKT